MNGIGKATLFLTPVSDEMLKAVSVPGYRYRIPTVKSQLKRKLLFTFMLEFISFF